MRASGPFGRETDVRRSPRPTRITDAAPSPAEQLHSRQVRYSVMLSIRAVCLILATVLVTTHAPGLVIWVPLLILGALVLPWLAVILENDRGPKDRYRIANRLGRTPPNQRALTATDPRDGEDRPRVIDADS